MQWPCSEAGFALWHAVGAANTREARCRTLAIIGDLCVEASQIGDKSYSSEGFERRY